MHENRYLFFILIKMISKQESTFRRHGSSRTLSQKKTDPKKLFMKNNHGQIYLGDLRWRSLACGDLDRDLRWWSFLRPEESLLLMGERDIDLPLLRGESRLRGDGAICLLGEPSLLWESRCVVLSGGDFCLAGEERSCEERLLWPPLCFSTEGERFLLDELGEGADFLWIVTGDGTLSWVGDGWVWGDCW